VLQRRAQLFVQDTLKAMEQVYDLEQLKRKDSAVTEGGMSTHDAASVKGGVTSVIEEVNPEDERIDLTIKEYHDFTTKIQSECFDKHLPGIQALAKKIFSFKGINEPLSSEDQSIK
jgi:hypothetical protein